MLNKRGSRGRINRDPLRKIVGHEDGFEVLECGHRQRPKTDFVGETNAQRRRCRKCRRLADGESHAESS